MNNKAVFKELSLCATMTLSLSLVLTSGTALAALITPAPGQTATVDQSFNNKPQILDIAKPNAQGLSDNQFTDFNVGTNGLVINNANQATTSQLAGAVMANPNFAGSQGATLILNQVTSGNPSQLLGYQELVGRQAQYVLANPGGITCNGCGFINFPRATLTTGTPNIVNGQFTGATVNGGEISVTGTGLNAGVNILDLVARQIYINAQINATDLKIIAGDNTYDYATRTGTSQGLGGGAALAIDSTALGGIYAGTISLISTEAGSGVKMLGDVAASTGDLTLSSNGDLTLSGNKVSAKNNLSASAANGTATVTGAQVYAGTNLTLNDINTQISGGASLGAAQDLSLTGTGALTVTGSGNKIFAASNTTLNTSGNITAAGLQLEGDNNLTITGKAISFTGGSTVTGDATAYRAGTAGSGALTLNASGALSTDSTSSLASGGTMTVNASGQNATLSGTTDALGNATLTAAALTNGGTFDSQGNITLNAGQITNNQKISAAGNVTIGSNGYLDNTSGATLSAAQSLTITATNTSPSTLGVTNAGIMFGGTALTISNGATVPLANNGGTIFSRGNILLGAATAGAVATGQSVTNTDGLIESYNGGITINADTITNQQTTADATKGILAAGNIGMNFVTSLTNQASTISSAQNININGDALATGTNKGTLTNDDPNSVQPAVIEAVGSVNISNVSQVNNGTIGQNSSAGGTTNQTNPSTLSNLTLPTNPNGLFVVSQNPTSHYLVETNPAYDLKALYGSDYLLTRLGYDPANFQIIGDNAYQLQLLQQQLMQEFGVQFVVANAATEDAQFKKLMDNAVSEQKSLNLTVGVALTASQIQNLTKDMVWMVSKVVDGHKVLVPQVYLSQATIARLSTTRNMSRISAGNSLNIANAGEVNNNAGALQGGQDVNISTSGDIVNTGGQISAGRDVALASANGNIINQAAVYTTTSVNKAKTGSAAWFKDFFSGKKTETTTKTEHAVAGDISGGRNVSLNAKKNINVTGSRVAAGNDMTLQAGKNINVAAQTLTDTTTKTTTDSESGFFGLFHASRNGTTSHSSQTHAASSLSSGNNMSLIANDSVSNTDSNISAGTGTGSDIKGQLAIWAKTGDILNRALAQNDQSQIGTTGDILMLAGKDITNDSGVVGAGGNLLMQAQKGDITNTTNIFRHGNNANYHDERGQVGTFASGGDTTLLAGNDIDVTGADVTAGGTIGMGAQSGNVNIKSQELHSKSTTIHTTTSSSGWWIFKKKHTKTTKTVHYNTTNVLSNISGDKGVTIFAKKDINQIGGNVTSKLGGLTYQAGNDINVSGVMNSSSSDTHSSNSTDIMGVQTSGGKSHDTATDQNWVGSSLAAATGINMNAGDNITFTGSNATAGGNIGLNAQNGSVNILAAVETDTQSHDSSAHKFVATAGTQGASAYARAGHEWNSEHKNGSEQNIVGSSLSAGGNMTVTAKKDINLQSSDLAAGQNAALTAGQNVNITALAAHDSYSDTKTSRQGGFGANANLEKSTAGSYYAGSESDLNAKADIHRTSSITTGGNLSVTAQKGDITEEAAQVASGGNIAVNAGGSFISKAVEDTYSVVQKTTSRISHLGLGLKTSLQGAVEGIAGIFGVKKSKIDDGQQTAAMSGGGLYGGVNGDYNQHETSHSVNAGIARTSSWTAGGNLAINANKNIIMTGSQLAAGGSLGLTARTGDISLLAAQDYTNTSQSDTLFGGEAIGGPENGYVSGGYLGTSTTQGSTTADTVGLSSGGDMSLSAGHDMTLQGTQAAAGGDMALAAQHDINITAAQNTYNSSTNTLDVQGSAGISPAGKSGRAHVVYEDDEVNSSDAVVSNLSSGRNFSLNAGHNATLVGTNVNAAQSATLNAGNDFDYQAAHNTYSHTDTYVDTFVTLSKASKASEEENIVRNGYNFSNWQRLKSRLQYWGARAARTKRNLSRTQKKYNQSMSVSVRTENTKMDQAVGGSVNAGGNLSISAGHNATLTGTQGHAGGDLSLQAGNNLDLEAAKSTADLNKTSVAIGASSSAAGFQVSDLHDKSTSYSGTALTAGGTAAIKAGNDFTLKGSAVSGNAVTANVGHNMTVAALVNSETFRGGGAGLGLGGNLTGATAPTGFGGTAESVVGAGLKGNNSLTVNVSGNTDLKGGALRTGNGGALSVTTGSLSTSDVSAHSKFGSITNWGTTSTQTATATIGGGNLTIRNGGVPSNLNRNGNAYITTVGKNPLVGNSGQMSSTLNAIHKELNGEKQKAESDSAALKNTAAGLRSKVPSSVPLVAPKLTSALKANVLNIVKSFNGDPAKVPLTVQKTLLKRAGMGLPANASTQEIHARFADLFKQSK